MSSETYERPQPDAAPTEPRFTPFFNTVILRPVRPEVQEKTAGGIILPESVKDAEKNKPLSAIALYEVVAFDVGFDPFVYRLEVGCKVWVRSYVADSFDQAGTFVAVDAKDIWARVDE